MAYEDYYEKVQEIYLAYYGRAADQEGLAYWSVLLDQEDGNLDNIIEAFANSEESQNRYGDLGNADKVTSIYQSLFDRDPDHTGLNFYVSQVEQGAMTDATIMLDILNGARGGDREGIDSFVTSAMAALDRTSLNQAASGYAEEFTAESALPETLALSDGFVYEVVSGTAQDDQFTHLGGDKIYVGFEGNDRFDVDPAASGRAIFVGGEGDDTYNLRDAAIVVVKDSGGGSDTINSYAGSAISSNYTVDNKAFVSEFYTATGEFYGNILIGDLRAPEDYIESLNLVGVFSESFSQNQAIEIYKQFDNWYGNRAAEDVGLSGLQEDIDTINALVN
ncbi:DUF4214 domain-containing protein [Spiribacter aquaticus]|uniref:DUF4214 domain-containing protein n=1 Tax=Spiribacter aquaticus TaxID=1935996 RepID=A0A557RGP8_9GAMM|nr:MULTISPECIES: DUF4214 domain-containing protein [Spiribacter]KAF0280920.1 hypothetical protein BA897_09805 [Spiribacter roseus]TVO64322.1 DUF4214 domain-containing protein [Spiribacter aquaticus]